MLEWPKGVRKTDGIWFPFWYKEVINSTTFKNYTKKKIILPKKYNKIYHECLNIYNYINNYKI